MNVVRRLTAVCAALGIGVSGLAVTSAVDAGEDSPVSPATVSVERLGQPRGSTILSRSTNYAIQSHAGEVVHIDVRQDVHTVLPAIVALGDPRFRQPWGPHHTFGFESTDSSAITRTDIRTGITETFAIAFPPDSASIRDYALQPDRSAPDDTGRYVAVVGSDPGSLRLDVYVFDIETGGFTPSSADTLWTGDGYRFGVESMAPDGSYIVTRQKDGFGFSPLTYFRWDLATGTSTSVATPPEAGVVYNAHRVSDDLEWVVFYSDEAEVVPGLGAARRVYRRHVPTGSTDVVPVPQAQVQRMAVHNGGRVVFTAGPSDRELRLYSWDGGDAPLVNVTSFVDADDPDASATEYWSTNLDGTSVLFDAVVERTRADGTTVDSWNPNYLATLSPIDAQEPATPPESPLPSSAVVSSLDDVDLPVPSGMVVHAVLEVYGTRLVSYTARAGASQYNRFLYDTVTQEIVEWPPIPGTSPVFSDDLTGLFNTGPTDGGWEIARWDRATGDVTVAPFVNTGSPVVVAADASGQLIATRSPSVLYDMVTGSVVEPVDIGIPVDVVPTVQRISSDGRRLVYTTGLPNGRQRWTLHDRDGVGRLVDEPDGLFWSEAWWRSPDLEWIAFVSDRPGIVDGADTNARRLYRRHVDTGVIELVSVNAMEVEHVAIADTGRLVLSLDRGGDHNELWLWDRGAPVDLLSSLPASVGVQRPSTFWLDPDGSSVLVNPGSTSQSDGCCAPLLRLRLDDAVTSPPTSTTTTTTTTSPATTTSSAPPPTSIVTTSSTIAQPATTVTTMVATTTTVVPMPVRPIEAAAIRVGSLAKAQRLP